MSDFKKQSRAMMEAALEQGFRVEDKKSGWIVYGKNIEDGFCTIHKTPSDKRGLLNIRATLRRMGVRL